MEMSTLNFEHEPDMWGATGRYTGFTYPRPEAEFKNV
jgi:hypothetical protein